MTFFSVPAEAVAPVVLPDGERSEEVLYTGTACLALMDADATGEVWEDLLFDGYGHEHGAGGLMLNGAAVGTHLEHDGEFPVEVVRDADGFVTGFRVNLDPYAEDLAEVRNLDGHGGHPHAHSHAHSHADGEADHEHGPEHAHSHDHDGGHDGGHDHAHGEDHEHEHGHGHADGWSLVEEVTLVSDRAVLGDPAGLPEADNTGGLIAFTFPAPAGTVSLSVFTDSGLRRELVARWSA